MGQSGGTGRSIRSQLNRIVLIPSITSLLLFVILSGATLVQAFSLRTATEDGKIGLDLYRAVVQLQHERRLALAYLGDPSTESLQVLREQADITDDAVRGFQEKAGDLEESDEALRRRAVTFVNALESRSQVRESVVAGELDPDAAIDAYGGIVTDAYAFYEAKGRLLEDGQSVAQIGDAVSLLRAQELFSRADALLTGAAARGELSPEEQTRFAANIVNLRYRMEVTGPVLGGSSFTAYTRMTSAEGWAEINRLADRVAAYEPEVTVDPITGQQSTSRDLPVEGDAWREAADSVDAAMVVLGETQIQTAINATDSASAQMFTTALGAGLLSLFAATLAYMVASRSANRLTRRLVRLRADTLSIAHEDLPRIVHRLGEGESVDLDAEMKQLDYGTDEVGQVADAFNTAQRTAVAAAVKQAEIREGANRVFLGIAHRNQSLVQRQLQLLDRVEREEEDPDLLEHLFQLDHLATRGRRNAENLIILGGSQPGRRWRNPIPLVDILRGAISETEEYARVKLKVVPNLSLRGAVVADVIHLVAELVENATAFSPPHTKVHIHSEIVPKGVVVEVEDRGLGMGEDDYAEANETLSGAPEFDVMAINEDTRLGLFVVARLAAKHDINVRLCSSPYGGTRAVILIPAELIASGEHSDSPLPGEEPLARPGAADLLAPRDDRPEPRPPASPPPPRPVIRSRPAVTDTAGRREDALVSAPTASRPTLPTRPTNGSATAAPSKSADRPELPKRRRQANLAPQLRQETAQGAADGVWPSTIRSPEEARRVMDAFQSGTRRGRAEDLGDPPSEPLEGAWKVGEGDHPGSATTARSGDGDIGRPAGDHTEESE
ncbi:sensor histidine kinase [Marinactinospora thermotolerans]|uniref:histidine kinase n=1 Tax=Marinactinospora thermotolerans DSM 45154 TaxID=1122192 RepID=A0A1T4SJS6_9ACTN|nr:nitrate- and nitrite sensing domain-containing protein [Marinactinospora thermotolerans]SKA28436.1 Signal transduction histidine kinase [Marinactinospora thermotolerans DSM 45154]